VDSVKVWADLLALGDLADEDYDDEQAWELIHLLRKQGEPELVDLVLPLLRDPDEWHRQIAAQVLGQYGYEQGRPFGERVMPELVRAARVEPDDETRAIIVDAIGDAEDSAWVPELLRYVRDPYAPVRQSVAASLPRMLSGEEMNASAVEALIVLTADADSDVRDWATFSLGNQSDQDSPAIREAFAARLEDEDRETRFEAVLGLSRRGDPRALEPVLRTFTDPDAAVFLLDLAAAAALADPLLLPALLQLRASWDDDEDEYTVALINAIDRCRPETQRLAAVIEAQLTTDVNRGLSGTGWAVNLTGEYPRTVRTIIRPDGSFEPRYGPCMIWEYQSPAEFVVAENTTNWIAHIRSIAAAAT
jgi:HEAT repeat protein